MSIGLKQCYEAQALAFEALHGLSKQIKTAGDPRAICKLANAFADLSTSWCQLEERKRILRGIPLPGTLKPTAALNARKARATTIIDATPLALAPAAPLPAEEGETPTS